jgi:hypothetical protein
MSAHLHDLRLLPLLAIALALGSLVAPISARQEPASQPFAVAGLFVELNDTDDDLGIHAPSSPASYPPAMAPTTRNGSSPLTTAMGSGVSGGSWDRSSSQA